MRNARESTPSLRDRFLEAKKKEPFDPEMTGSDAAQIGFVDRSVSTFANAVPGALDMAGAVGGTAQALFNTGIDAAKQLGGSTSEFGILNNFLKNREEAMQGPAIQTLRSMPRFPENVGENVRGLSRMMATPEIPEGATEEEMRAAFENRPGFGQARFQEALRRQQAEEEFPGSLTAGTAASDVLALTTGRRPLARARVPDAAMRREALVARAKADMERLPTSVADRIEDSFSRRMLPWLKDTLPSNIKSGLGKGLESGLEAATLSAIHDSSPEAAFGIGAGTQLAGSLGLFLTKTPARALSTFAGTWMAAEMVKAIGPGEQGLFESKDFAIQKAVLAMAWGSSCARR